MLLGSVDDHVLPGLLQLAVDRLGDDLRLTDGELETFATHGLDEDGQRHLATTLDFPGVRTLGRQDLDGDVTDELLVQAVLDHTGGELVAGAAGHRGGVHTDGHGDGRLVDGDAGQGHRVLRVGEGVADHDVLDTGDGGDVTGDDLVGGDSVHADGAEQLGDLDVLDVLLTVLVVVDPGDLLALVQGTGEDADQADAAEEVGGVQVGDVGLQRGVVLGGGLREDVVDDVEEGLEVLGVRDVAVARVLGGGLAGATGGVDDREVEEGLGGLGGLRVVEGGRQLEEQVLCLGDDLVDAGVGTVGLVDADDDRHLGL